MRVAAAGPVAVAGLERKKWARSAFHVHHAANADLSRAYFDVIEAPVKGFYLFDESAHSPLFEEPERARRILLQDVLSGRAELADPLRV